MEARKSRTSNRKKVALSTSSDGSISTHNSDSKHSTSTLPVTPDTETSQSSAPSLSSDAILRESGNASEQSNRRHQRRPPEALEPDFPRFDEELFRKEWLGCGYDFEKLKALVTICYTRYSPYFQDDSDHESFYADLKKAFRQGQSKRPEYKAKACDDAVRILKEAERMILQA